MTDKTRTFHCRATGLTLQAFTVTGSPIAGRILRRGETFEISPEEYELSKDRLGRSWLDLTPEEQVQRWGMQRFGTGPAPEGMGIGEDDELVQFERGFNALKYARAINDPRERAAAVKEAWAKFGSYLTDLHNDFRHQS